MNAADFWAARPVLSHIRAFSLARMVAPYATLGCVLLNVLQQVPPVFVLPPIVGGDGSLNVFVALVGRSGSGKGAAMAVADDCLTGIPSPHRASIGSGEGIGHQYGTAGKEGFQYDRTAALFETAEIDGMAANASRQGSTLLDQLRKAYSAEALGFAYASKEKRLDIGAHSYRFGFVAGVQPGRSGALLNDADGGTPQRFLWLPSTDPAITAEPVAEPSPLAVELPSWNVRNFKRSAKGRAMIEVPNRVAEIIRQARADNARGKLHALDGHRLFTQEKIAAALAVLDGRTAMSFDDWELSQHLMGVSDVTRARCVDELRSNATKAAVTKLTTADDAKELAEAAALSKMAATIIEKLPSDGTLVSASPIRQGVRSTKRPLFDDALDRLKADGAVTSASRNGTEWIGVTAP